VSHLIDMATDPDPIDTKKWQASAKDWYKGTLIVGEDLQRIPFRA
jgi:hypothetical protein